jgi:hypothetical protein
MKKGDVKKSHSLFQWLVDSEQWLEKNFLYAGQGTTGRPWKKGAVKKSSTAPLFR